MLQFEIECLSENTKRFGRIVIVVNKNYRTIFFYNFLNYSKHISINASTDSIISDFFIKLKDPLVSKCSFR